MQTHTTIHKPALTLKGVSVRTTNAEETGPNGQLGQLWDSYFQNSPALQAGANTPHLIYALYTDYESDASGAYTVVIGHEADGDTAAIDHDFVSASLPASKYMVFTTQKGPVFEVVVQAWEEIWAYFRGSSSEVRTYTGDFELYDARQFDPLNTEVQIYIAIQ